MQLPFHQDEAPELVLRGGKRSGKSVAAICEFASRVLGIPIIGPDGNPLPLRYPSPTPDSPRQYWIIGWDTTHAGTIHRLLFQPGMGGTMRCIPDEETGEWRLWNRSNPRDVERQSESSLTEPVIPARFLKDGDPEAAFSWSEKKTCEFHSFQLENGALVFYWPSSARSPKQGEAVSGILIDEDIQFSGHLKEWQDRLTDMKGWFMWSVWPHIENDALNGLADRATLELDNEKPQIRFHQLIMSRNPFLEQESIEQALGRMGNEEEVARRDRGEMDRGTFLMYDFNRSHHLLYLPGESLVGNPAEGSPRFVIESELSRMNGVLPREWTRYLAIDPSNTRTAVMSMVVPPPEYNGVYLGPLVIVEWEMVVRKYSAHMLATALQPLMVGRHYEAFIMDQQIGRQTNVGRDNTVFAIYEEAFRKKGLRSRQTISWFIPGCNVPTTRFQCVRQLLLIQDTGIPMLLLVAAKTPYAQSEFSRYRKKKVKAATGDILSDGPANAIDFDCMAAIEYGGTHLLPLLQTGQAYQEPEVYGSKTTPLLERVAGIKKAQRDSQSDHVHLGPGSGVV